MGITTDGIKGEQSLFALLRNKGFKFFQPDAIGYKDGCYYMFETKHQEKFTPPPFNGHGLPKWQVMARLEFQRRTMIPCVLVVFDKEDGNVYWQRMDKLEQGEHIDTHGTKPRRIYNLKEFNIAKGNLNDV